MKQQKNPLSASQSFVVCIATFSSLILATASQAQETSALIQCTQISDDNTRLACYDSLMLVELSALTPSQTEASQTEASAELEKPIRAAPVPAKVTTANAVAKNEDKASASVLAPKPAVIESKEVLPQDLGGSKFAPKEEVEAAKNASYRGKIVACSKGGDGKHFFTFDNGQIWKQVKSSKKRYKNCDFDVTVSKDVFGYKMAIDGRRGNVRINRKR